ncbi:hypothetical protein CYMTET_42313 [Cymbomonas tetramitiformis]|uniref:Uncharacterized protein n=1 Tax=Cymbomonas tetramitiformis TaxID=36881 RepID=A0AAE0C4D8_9CHLO|nr:hypothetical protein CYMTET_42313 [Cymbomonas tetramitiformis]
MFDKQLFGEGFKAQSVEDLDKSGTREFVQKLKEAEARGTKPGLFDIFSAGVEKEDAEEEEKEEAEENDEGEEEDAEEEDEEDEMQIGAPDPRAGPEKKKYTTFATQEGF